MPAAPTVVLVIAAVAGVACLILSNAVFFRLLREVNSRSEPSERIETPFIKNHVFGMFGIIRRHRELYPESRLRKRMSRATVVGFLLLFAAFCGAVAISTDASVNPAGSPHTHG
jgi:hypothetical protein